MAEPAADSSPATPDEKQRTTVATLPSDLLGDDTEEQLDALEDFVDDVHDPDAEPDDEPRKPKAADDEPDDDDDDDDDEPAEPEADDDAEPEKAAKDDDDEDGIDSLAGVAEVFGVSEQDFAETIQVEIDGETMTLAELVDSAGRAPEAYRLAQEVETERADLSRHQQHFQQQQQAFSKDLVPLVRELARMVEIDESPASEQEMAALQQSDPDAYNAKRLKQLERKEAQRTLDARLSEEHQRQQEHESQEHAAWATKEEAKLIRRLPAWKDKAKRDAESALTARFLINTLGFTREDVEGMEDHRMILLAREAALSHAAKKGARHARKKRRLPKPSKVIRSGARSGDEPGKKRSAKLRRRLQQTGDDRFADALLEDFV